MAGAPAIGFFDSGVGGISVWRAVSRRLPDNPTLYVADNAHCPYGPRDPRQIRRFSGAITRFLLGQGADLIVVACNTASAAALQWLRARFDVPFVGMEPAVKPAAQQTRTGHVGVLATRGTVDGDLFRNTAARHAGAVTVHVQVGDGLVDCVESGRADAPETEELVRRYVDPMVQAGVDQIVLGCTHYAFLLPALRRVLPVNVTVVDAAEAVARQVEHRIAELPRVSGHGLHADTRVTGDEPGELTAHSFFVTGASDGLASLLRSELGCAPPVQRIGWRGGRLQHERAARMPGSA